MGLLSFLRKKDTTLNKSELSLHTKSGFSSNESEKALTEKGDLQNVDDVTSFNNVNSGIDQVYAFLQANYESKGYNDSFINSDDSYKSDNLKLIRFDLQILIDKTYAYYDNLISDIDFHIKTRHKAGLDDLVQELEARKILVGEYKLKLKSIKESINDENGMCQRIILSYQRGFMRGLSVLTQSNILSKRL